MALNHGPLNALIEGLESMEDSDRYDVDGDGVPSHDVHDADEDDSSGGGHGDAADDDPNEQELEAADGTVANIGEQSPIRENPPTPRRVPSRTISRYLSSPHARRERVKQSPCMFCVENKDVLTLRDHLESSILCRTNYYSLLHVNSIDAVLSKTYVCIFCPDVGASLKTHLRTSNDCFQAYTEKFNVDSLDAIIVEVRKLKRNNKRENYLRFKKSEEENPMKTKVRAINDNLHATSLLNYRICVLCRSCFTENSSIIIDEQEPKFDGIDGSLRRMTKMYICLQCNKLDDEEDVTHNPSNNLRHIDFDNRDCLIVPSASIFNGNEEAVDGEEAWEDKEFSSEVINNIMFPSSVFSEVKDIDISSCGNINVLFNKCDPPKKSVLGHLYSNQLRKYKNIVTNAKRYTGTIVEGDQRTITDIKALTDDAQIRGSNNWFNRQGGNIERRFEQYGQCAFKMEVKVPHNNEETIANSLLLEGISITVSYIGDECLEQERRFLVHPNHAASEFCSNEDCEKIALGDYLEGRELDFDSIKYISTYLYSISFQLQSLVENIVKCPSSELFSEDFYFTVLFDGHGVGYIKGIFWPKQSLLYNEDKSEISFFGGGKDMKEKYLEFVSKTVSSMSDEEDLKELFELNGKEAKKLSALVKKYQVHFGDNCDKCNNPTLPSLIGTFKCRPSTRAMHNIYEAREFCKMLLEMLTSITEDEIVDLTTLDWLKEISVWKVEMDEEYDTEEIQFTLNGREFCFILDERLVEMITKFDDSFIGLYHYAISCSDNNSDYVILKRNRVLDSFTHIFNPFYLSAMKTTLEIVPTISFSDWTTDNLPKIAPGLSEADVDEKVRATHSQISLYEAYSLFEPKIIRDISSVPVVYVNTNIDAKLCFVKTKERTETSFEAVGEGNFEVQHSIVSKHKMRLNGQNLLLSEVAMNYETVPAEESKQLFEIYKDQINKVPESETCCVVSQEKMPSVLICSNGSCLKIRKSPKVLNYPTYETGSKKQRFSRVLLFYPHPPNFEINDDQIDAFFFETKDDAPRDLSGKKLTIVDDHERKLFKTVLHNNFE